MACSVSTLLRASRRRKSQSACSDWLGQPILSRGSTKPSPAVKVRYANIPRHRLDRHRHCTIRSAVGGEAQSNTKPVIAPPSRTINLTAEQSFIVKEIVLKDLNVSKSQAGAPESIGVPVPPSVELHDMTPALAENVPQAKSHA